MHAQLASAYTHRQDVLTREQPDAPIRLGTRPPILRDRLDENNPVALLEGDLVILARIIAARVISTSIRS